MKIGLAGSISVGKTTLAKELGKLPQFENYEIITERSKYLRDLGIQLNSDSTLPGQIIFAAERASELLKENIITDRSIYDVCTFTLSAKSIDWKVKEEYCTLMLNLRGYYDIIIYVSPEGVDIEDNQVRTTDAKYREQLDYVVKELIKQYPPNKLIEVKGPTEERIATILANLN